MKKRSLRVIFALSALVLCSAAVFGFSEMNSYTGSANTNVNNDFPCAYSAAPTDTEYMCYGSSEVIKYTVEDREIEEPEVPEKSGYVGRWEEYTLTMGNITVEAVYTKIEDLPPQTSEQPGDSEAPETSEQPGDSEIPETSEKPEVSEAPEDSEASEGTSEEELPEASESTNEPKKESKSKGGCGGVTTAGAIAMMTAVGTALLLKKKED